MSKKTKRKDAIPDEEIEMFLNDLTVDDWVFLIKPNGQLKSMIVPKMEPGDEVNSTIVNIFDALDPKLLDTIMETTTIEELEDIDVSFQNLTKKPNDTIH